MSKAEPPTIKETKKVRIAEHEILLSFVGDLDAVAFYYWWNKEGKEAFLNSDFASDLSQY